jgi:hypothetical protein
MQRYDDEDELDALGWLVLTALCVLGLLLVAVLALALWMEWI